MSEKLKIKISIADRVYPLTVDVSQEEGLRSASKKIDAMMKQFEQSYAQDNETAIARLQNLDKKLSELLSK